MLYLNIDDHKITALVADETATGTPVMIERSVMTDKHDEALAEIAQQCRDSHVWPPEVTVFVCGPVTIAPSEETVNNPEVVFANCFDFTDKTQRRVCCDEIVSLRSSLILGVNASIMDALSHHFPESEVNYHSSLTPMLEVFSRNYDTAHRLRTYLHCREGFIDILAFDGRNLTILNSFPVCSVSDAVYYAIALSKSLGFDVHTMPFYLCGDRTMIQGLRLNMQRFSASVIEVNLVDDLPSSYSLIKQQLPHSIAAHLTCA